MRTLLTRSTQSAARDRGFTLIEALVALAIMTAGLAAIGRLGFSALSAARRSETRLDLISAARAAATSLPDRRASRDGVQSGSLFKEGWRLVSAPYVSVAPEGPKDSGWTPQILNLQVSDPSGGSIVVQTVRLRRSGR